MSFRRLHAVGCDVLGAGASDFVPWLGIVGKAMGGIGDVLSPNQQQKTDPAAQQKAIEDAIKRERQREEAERAKAAAARDRAILYVVLGVVGVAGVGATVMLVRKK